jgi:hypothetical protein
MNKKVVCHPAGSACVGRVSIQQMSQGFTRAATKAIGGRPLKDIERNIQRRYVHDGSWSRNSSDMPDLLNEEGDHEG